MKLSRKAQLWIADRSPAFDHPGLYRRVPSAPVRPTVSGWDAVLIGLIGLVLIVIGIAALLGGLFLAATLIAAAFS